MSSYVYAFVAAHRTNELTPWLIVCNIVFEIVFVLDIIVNMILSYTEEGTGNDVPVRSIFKISKRYLKGRFIFDLIPIIPLQDFPSINNRSSLFYLVKLIRL